MRVELLQGRGTQFAPRTSVAFRADKAPLASLLNGVGAHVVWQDGTFCGIQFTSKLKISIEELRRLISAVS